MSHRPLTDEHKRDEAFTRIRNAIAYERARMGRDWLRALPFGHELDALDSGLAALPDRSPVYVSVPVHARTSSEPMKCVGCGRVVHAAEVRGPKGAWVCTPDSAMRQLRSCSEIARLEVDWQVRPGEAGTFLTHVRADASEEWRKPTQHELQVLSQLFASGALGIAAHLLNMPGGMSIGASFTEPFDHRRHTALEVLQRLKAEGEFTKDALGLHWVYSHVGSFGENEEPHDHMEPISVEVRQEIDHHYPGRFTTHEHWSDNDSIGFDILELVIYASNGHIEHVVKAANETPLPGFGSSPTRPGDQILMHMHNVDMTADAFVESMGDTLTEEFPSSAKVEGRWNRNWLHGLLTGETPINGLHAYVLEKVFPTGPKAREWLAMENRYRESLKGPTP